jgi:DNA repair photolyase
MNWAIRNKYFIELGTTGETFQEADRYFRVSYNFLRLTSDFHIPLFINTKMNLLCRDNEYKKLLVNYKAPIIICLSLTTEDDKLGKLYAPKAPLPSERLKAVKEFNSYDHIETIVYISPFIPGVTDRDPERYTKAMIDAKITGAHLRDFYIQGKTFNNQFWQKYRKENAKNLEVFPCGYHVKYEIRRKFYDEVDRIGRKLDPNFRIVGMKTKWFELNPYHGKMCYDTLPQSFKDGIVDFTAIPIMRKIRKNLDKPQLLIWDKIGYQKDKINLPEKINTNEGGINNLMEGLCNCDTSDVNYELDGYEWLKGGLWNGWDQKKPSGFFNTLDYIFPVRDKGGYVKDKSGNFIYAYLPKKDWKYLQSQEQSLLFAPTSKKEIKNPSIEYKTAKGFKKTTRKGGTEDKFLKTEKKEG